MEIVLATANLHKIQELREMFKELKGVEILSLSQFPQYSPPEETADSFIENAKLKGLHAASFLKKVVVADDSGLVVPALEGRPGVHSRRYAGNMATDAENRKKLIQDLQFIDESCRFAYFECALVLATPAGIKKAVSAKVEGTVITEELGRDGFGYDSLFKKLDYDKTFAQIGKIKNRISHRRKAFEKLRPLLESLLHHDALSH